MSCIITRTRGVYTKNGRPASDADQTRAKKLGIPPAYTDVCVFGPNAKLQATAMDATAKLTTITTNSKKRDAPSGKNAPRHWI